MLALHRLAQARNDPREERHGLRAQGRSTEAHARRRGCPHDLGPADRRRCWHRRGGGPAATPRSPARPRAHRPTGRHPGRRPGLERLPPHPGLAVRRPDDRADGPALERRADPDRLPGHAVRHHPGRGGNRLRQSRATRPQHPARGRPGVLRGLAEQPERGQRVPGHEPLLDGGHVRSVRRGPRRLRAVSPLRHPGRVLHQRLRQPHLVQHADAGQRRAGRRA